MGRQLPQQALVVIFRLTTEEYRRTRKNNMVFLNHTTHAGGVALLQHGPRRAFPMRGSFFYAGPILYCADTSGATAHLTPHSVGRTPIWCQTLSEFWGQHRRESSKSGAAFDAHRLSLAGSRPNSGAQIGKDCLKLAAQLWLSPGHHRQISPEVGRIRPYVGPIRAILGKHRPSLVAQLDRSRAKLDRNLPTLGKSGRQLANNQANFGRNRPKLAESEPIRPQQGRIWPNGAKLALGKQVSPNRAPTLTTFPDVNAM